MEILTLCMIGISIVLILIVAIPVGLILALKNAKTPSIIKGTYGTAHFATEPEVQAAHLISEKKRALAGEHYLYLGVLLHASFSNEPVVIALNQRQQESHVLLVAPTGNGKTSCIIIPNLLYENGRRSLFINDIKGELVDKCAGALAQRHHCFIFAPTRPARSHHYNPLAHVQDMNDAEDLAAAIV